MGMKGARFWFGDASLSLRHQAPPTELPVRSWVASAGSHVGPLWGLGLVPVVAQTDPTPFLQASVPLPSAWPTPLPDPSSAHTPCLLPFLS